MRVLLEHAEGLVRVRGDQHRVALPLEQSPGQLAKSFASSTTSTVCAPARGRVTGGGTPTTVSARPPGEIHLERRAPADFAVDVDAPAALRDDAVHRRQAQARALADLLGGEERFEQVRLYRGVVPVPVSLTVSTTYGPGLHRNMRLCVVLVESTLAVSIVNVPPPAWHPARSPRGS